MQYKYTSFHFTFTDHSFAGTSFLAVETKQGSKIRHGQKGEGDIRINNVEDVPYPFEGMVA